MTEHFYALTAVLSGIALVVSTAEHLSNRREMLTGRILSWSVLGVDRNRGRAEAVRRGVAWLMGYRPFTAILAVQGLATLLMVAFALNGIFSAVVQGVILVGQLLVLYRNRYALEGADQMMLIVTAALFCYSLAPTSVLVACAGLWFIALQSALSYVVAGVAKIGTPGWRSGEALQAVMNTEAYGTRAGAAILLHRPRAARILCWQVMLVESLFPLALVLGPPYGAIFLFWGAAFHGCNVLVMGLHRFLWAFLASYPAVWFCMTHRWG